METSNIEAAVVALTEKLGVSSEYLIETYIPYVVSKAYLGVLLGVAVFIAGFVLSVICILNYRKDKAKIACIRDTCNNAVTQEQMYDPYFKSDAKSAILEAKGDEQFFFWMSLIAVCFTIFTFCLTAVKTFPVFYAPEAAAISHIISIIK